jgi:hypothetical protein
MSWALVDVGAHRGLVAPERVLDALSVKGIGATEFAGQNVGADQRQAGAHAAER